MLLERQAWQPLAGVCSSLLAASGDDATAQQRAVQAVGKLAGHMPEEAAATALAALAARTGSLALGSGAALGLLGLLCSAVQHASSTAACQQLQQAALSCTATAAAEGGSQQLLQTAALLLPALVVQAPGSGAGAADWLEPVASVVQVVTSAIEQLEGQLAAARPQPLGSQQVQVALLEAAFLPANALRRVLAAHLAAGDKAKGASGSSPGVGQLLGGAAAVAAAASTLELLCGMVWLSSRQDSLDGSQDHAAAVGLVTAARLRAACLSSRGDPAELVSSRAVRWLLGWDLQAYCAGRCADARPPRPACADALSLLPCFALRWLLFCPRLFLPPDFAPLVPCLLQRGAAACCLRRGAPGALLAGLCLVQRWRGPAWKPAVRGRRISDACRAGSSSGGAAAASRRRRRSGGPLLAWHRPRLPALRRVLP